MKTVVLQSFRTTDVPAWMRRCMDSVRAWTVRQGYDYEFMDDRIFDLCGADYLAQVGDNKRSITNLARLELIRLRLAGAYERAIWLDADTFVFVPAAFRMDIRAGYAFAREVWVFRGEDGRTFMDYGVHNASCVFTRGQPDLDFFIHTARYIAATRHIRESFQVGVRLLSGLQYPLGFPLLQDSGLFSPDVVQALATGDDGLIAALARGHAHRLHAANLCWSKIDAADPDWAKAASDVAVAMDRLESSAGDVINRYCPVAAVPDGKAVAGPSLTDTMIPRRRDEVSYKLNSIAWLVGRALRLMALRALPARLTSILRRARGVAG